jgi:DNA-binding MarR family transcriptional regulator
VPSHESPASRQIHEAFTQLIRWAHRGDVRAALLGAAAQSLSPNDIGLLRTIAGQGPVRASTLATWARVDKSTVTPQVRRLEDRGLVTRRHDPGDRRAALLTVTDHGRAELDEIDEIGTGLFGSALQEWTSSDRDTLATLIQRLAAELTATAVDRPAVDRPAPRA